MAITAALVKELRTRTGAGMMDCKKALVQTKGNLEEAIVLMRASGAVKAAKKSGRIASEGIVKVALSADKRYAILLEVNTETDFASKSSDFTSFVDELVALGLTHRVSNVEKLVVLQMGRGGNVEEERQNLVAKIGENVTIRRLFATTVQEGVLGIYQHGGRIATISVLDNNNATLAKDIAMHVAATNPQCLTAKDVPEALLAQERAIFTAQAQKSGKANVIVEKIVNGKLHKFVTEITLYGQSFIKDPSTTITQLVKNNRTKVLAFMRYEVGEGIQKEQIDFRSEVMARVKGG